ncbi:hypothetical protein GOFOIKOB_4623 [Methylobacterium tardum]|uniref:DUF1571 domain-containing protein n=1 Tax=Methylobacterium tardum TaxID=374432 RepID=A0AA37WTP0_9HYPH|nr:hypothetical protein [Methylobacterium tardum]URD39368.1 hypothetical protein M6G65_13740 [Methylobacterium tardum]GJE51563.1 hypothetical protein GOFOIKOB_4623 [Methylobacterium tardum]GLS73540.1 hypothetical protein GCM10007890_55550 [Methylobacterium tardum]
MRVLATTALALVLAALPAFAEDAAKPATVTQANAAAPPSAADLLFDQPQMKNAAPGSTITYNYLRRSGISGGPFGAPLQDTVALKIEPGKSPDARDIRVTMFSGLNRVPAGPFEDMAGNPVVSLFLENHLRALAKVLEANPRYLKLAIRRGLREKATVTPTKVEFDGRSVDGWRVVTKPFEGDAMTQRMRGLDDLTYTFVTAPSVPGEIVSIEASSKNKDGGELLEEKLNYDQKAG